MKVLYLNVHSPDVKGDLPFLGELFTTFWTRIAKNRKNNIKLKNSQLRNNFTQDNVHLAFVCFY